MPRCGRFGRGRLVVGFDEESSYWVGATTAAELLGVGVARLNQLVAVERIPFEVHTDGRRIYRREQLLTVAMHVTRDGTVARAPSTADEQGGRTEPNVAAKRRRCVSCGYLRLLLRRRPGQAVVEVLGGTLSIAAAQPCGCGSLSGCFPVGLRW